MKMGLQFVTPLWFAATRMFLGALGVPVLGVLSSALILGEGISLIIVSGLILISMGVLAVTVGGPKQLKFW